MKVPLIESDQDEIENEQNVSNWQALKAVFKGSSPFVISGILLTTSDFLGVVMISQLSSDALAASSLISSLQNCFASTSGATLSMTAMLTSRLKGKSETKQEIKGTIGNVLHKAWIFSLMLSAPAMVTMAFSKPMLLSLNQPEEVVDLVQKYFSWYIWGIPGNLMFLTNRFFTLGTSNQRVGAVLDACSRTLNVALSYCFIFGKFGFPRLEVAGLAVANLITGWTAFIGFTAYMMLSKNFKEYRLSSFNFNAKSFKPLYDLFAFGWPIGAKVFVELASLQGCSWMIGAMNKAQLAAHEASFQYIFMLGPTTFGIMDTLGSLVSEAIGKQHIKNAKKFGYQAITLGTGFALLGFAVFASAPNYLLNAFVDSDDPSYSDIISTGRTLLFINGLAQIADAVRNISSGGLSGFFETTKPTLKVVASTLCINMPLSYVLGYTLNYGAEGVMSGRGISILAGALLLMYDWFKIEKPLTACSENTENNEDAEDAQTDYQAISSIQNTDIEPTENKYSFWMSKPKDANKSEEQSYSWICKNRCIIL